MQLTSPLADIQSLDVMATFPAVSAPVRQVARDLCDHRGLWLALEFAQVRVRSVVQVGEVEPLGSAAREQLLIIAAPGHELELEGLVERWEPTRSFGNGSGVGEHYVYVAWDIPRDPLPVLPGGN